MYLYKLLWLSAFMLFNTDGYSPRIKGESGTGRGLYDDNLFELSASNRSNIFGRAVVDRCGPEFGFGSCPPGICCSENVCLDTIYIEASVLSVLGMVRKRERPLCSTKLFDRFWSWMRCEQKPCRRVDGRHPTTKK
jgi:hypothetical protein